MHLAWIEVNLIVYVNVYGLFSFCCDENTDVKHIQNQSINMQIHVYLEWNG